MGKKYYIKKCLILVTFIIISYGCNNKVSNFSEIKIKIENKEVKFYKKTKPYSGKIIDEYENGGLKSEFSTLDGSKDGDFIQYYENGLIQTSSNFKDGKLEGKFKSLYNNGIEQTITFYLNNLRMEVMKSFILMAK
tara:strand:- start:372 stop:779 length:408 start_codon:yes stop_codon:yes gene_type:complete